MRNNHRLVASLTESLVLGALTHNLEWMELSGVSVQQRDFATKDNQVLYSIMRDRLLEQNMEITAEQLMLEASKHPIKNGVTIELARTLREKIGFSVSFETFKKEVERLNKLRMLRAFDEDGFDLDEIIGEDSIDAPDIIDIVDQYNFEQLLNHFRVKIDTIEASQDSIKGRDSISAFDGLDELLETWGKEPQVGALLDGDLFNVVSSGAMFGRYHINSAGTGVGKTRMKLGNAALLAYPRIDDFGNIVHRVDGYYPVQFITTELQTEDVQKMLIACISGVEENSITDRDLTTLDKQKIELARDMIAKWDHFYIDRLENHSIAAVKSIAESRIRRNGVQYIFFDYIFSSGNISDGFRGNIREDVLLMHLSTALKDIAANYDVYVSTSTQLNAAGESGEHSKGVGMVRGSRAIIDKADLAMITTNITADDELLIGTVMDELNISVKPNIVTSIYKNRFSRYNFINIYRYFDKGTCRMLDLFVTNSEEEVVTIKNIYHEETQILEPHRLEELDNEPNRD